MLGYFFSGRQLREFAHGPHGRFLPENTHPRTRAVRHMVQATLGKALCGVSRCRNELGQLVELGGRMSQAVGAHRVQEGPLPIW